MDHMPLFAGARSGACEIAPAAVQNTAEQ